MIEDAASKDSFFLHVTYTAPHWPLHALEEDIEKYKEVTQKDGIAKKIGTKS